MIGKIKRVQLREVWKHEEKDFSAWLEENIEVLNEVLDLNLSNVEREKNVGDLYVDLVAEDENGNPVIIENQLGKSDHDHLGKIITYLSSIGAKTAIWVVSEPRPEHIKALTWLNESSASFYLVKVEAVQIETSPPAPLFTVIVAPSEEGRVMGQTKKEMAERDILRKKFWTQLLEYAKTKTDLHANLSPSHYNWIGTRAGIRGLNYNYLVSQYESNAELYVDRGRESDDENMDIFKQLLEHKSEIEKVFGEPLDWQELTGRRACRIKAPAVEGGYRDSEEKWMEIQEKVVDSMIRLEKALGPYIKKLKVEK